jgi:hypothetical protein
MRSPVKNHWPDPDRAPEEKLSIAPLIVVLGLIGLACWVGWNLK